VISMQTALLAARAAPLFPPALLTAGLAILHTQCTVSSSRRYHCPMAAAVAAFSFLSKTLELDSAHWNAKSRAGVHRGPLPLELDVATISSIIDHLVQTLGETKLNVTTPPDPDVSRAPEADSGKYSTLECEQTAGGEVCVATWACWQSDTVAIFRRRRTGDKSEAFRQLFPTPGRQCKQTPCRAVNIEQRYHGDWQTHPGWPWTRPSRFIDASVVVYDPPSPLAWHAAQQDLAYSLEFHVLPLFTVLQDEPAGIAIDTKAFFLSDAPERVVAWVSTLLDISLRHIRNEVPKDGRLCFRRLILGAVNRVGSADVPLPSPNPNSIHIAATDAAAARTLLQLRQRAALRHSARPRSLTDPQRVLVVNRRPTPCPHLTSQQPELWQRANGGGISSSRRVRHAVA